MRFTSWYKPRNSSTHLSRKSILQLPFFELAVVAKMDLSKRPCNDDRACLKVRSWIRWWFGGLFLSLFCKAWPTIPQFNRSLRITCLDLMLKLNFPNSDFHSRSRKAFVKDCPGTLNPKSSTLVCKPKKPKS